MGTKVNGSLAVNESSNLRSLSRKLMLDRDGFVQLSIVLTHLAGVQLTTDEKDRALMANRISPIMIKHGFQSYAEYLQVIGKGDPVIVKEFVSVMTTHTTQFFREREQIDFFIKHVPAYIKKKKKEMDLSLRIWCAACSTGQEAYTIALILHKVIPDYTNWDIKFLATDIDLEALKRAASGRYSDTEIASLPKEYRLGSTIRNQTEGTDSYQIHPKICSSIRFAPFNLLERVYPFQHPFDFIFCRNVLYYFGELYSQRIVKRLEAALVPQGCLYLGANESSYVKSGNLERIGPAVYLKKT